MIDWNQLRNNPGQEWDSGRQGLLQGGFRINPLSSSAAFRLVPSVAVTANQTQAPRRAELETATLLPPPPPRTWSRGPKSTNVSLRTNGSIALATSANAGVAFGLYGYVPNAACSVYWEFVCNETAATLGGFGVGGTATSTSSEPGKSSNPGVMLYYENSVYTLYNDGAESVLSGPAAPTRFGVSVTVIGANSISARFFVDEVEVTVTPVTWEFAGALWVPCACLLRNALQVTMEVSV